MASPVVAATNEGALTTAGTSHAITMPSGISAGDLLFVFFGTAAITDVTNWQTFTELFGSASSSVFGGYKVAAGGDTLTLTTAASTKSAHLTYRITGAADPGTQAPEWQESSGTGTTPNPDPISPTGGSKDYLFVQFLHQAGEEADDDTWCNSGPSGYTFTSAGAGFQKTSGTGGAASSNCSVASAHRQATTATEDAGTWSVDLSLAWICETVAFHPVAAATFAFPFLRKQSHMAMVDSDRWSLSGWQG